MYLFRNFLFITCLNIVALLSIVGCSVPLKKDKEIIEPFCWKGQIIDTLNDYNAIHKLWILGSEREIKFMQIEPHSYLISVQKIPGDKNPEASRKDMNCYFMLLKLNEKSNYGIAAPLRIYSEDELLSNDNFMEGPIIISILGIYGTGAMDPNLNALQLSKNGISIQQKQNFVNNVNAEKINTVFTKSSAPIIHNDEWNKIIADFELNLSHMIEEAIIKSTSDFSLFETKKQLGAFIYLNDFNYRDPDLDGYILIKYSDEREDTFAILSIRHNILNDFSPKIEFITYSPIINQKLIHRKSMTEIAKLRIIDGNYLIWQISGTKDAYRLKRINF